jgi:hypothetical protein
MADDRRVIDPTSLRPRPVDWHCMRCGWFCDHGEQNSYLCQQCGEVRALWAGSCTMQRCQRCGEWSLLIAEYCEWCGGGLAVRR